MANGIYSVVFSVLEPRIITTLHEGESQEDVRAKLHAHLKESGAVGFRIHEIELMETLDPESEDILISTLDTDNIESHPVQSNIVDFITKQKERTVD